MKIKKLWIGKICALIILGVFVSLTQSRAQTTPPMGMPVQYAAPFGVLTWNNGHWDQITFYGLTAIMTPSMSGQVDDLGNPYYALLDFQDSNDSTHNAQYYAYLNNTTLVLRLKPSSEGSSPFAELNGAILRNVLTLSVGNSLILTDSGIGEVGGGWAYWDSGNHPDFFYQVRLMSGGYWRGTEAIADAAGHLFFGRLIEYRMDYGPSKEQYAYLNADGTVRVGGAMGDTIILPINSNLSTTEIPNVVVVPSGMASTYLGPDSTVLEWDSAKKQFVGDYFGNTVVMQMGDSSSGQLAVWAPPEYSFFFQVSRGANGVLILNGGSSVGSLTDGMILVPSGLAAPIAIFQYDGQPYYLVSSAPDSSEQIISTYQNANGSHSAQVVWNIYTNAVSSINISLSSGNTAFYTPNGSGGYTWDANSTAANALTQVNGVNFVANGSYSDPAGVTQFSGDLDIRGNLLSLGSWNGDWSQVGLNLTYQDGDSAINSALAIWTASRPHTAWLWEHVNEGGGTPNTKPMMKLGSDNILTLYKTDGTVGITINPNSGRIRVAPQGDLSMGIFVQEPVVP